MVLDHATRDGLEGFVTITGGKLMTYRLMAEWTTDLICKKLNLTAKCTTAEEKLPGSREPEEEVNRRLISVPWRSAPRRSTVTATWPARWLRAMPPAFAGVRMRGGVGRRGGVCAQ